MKTDEDRWSGHKGMDGWMDGWNHVCSAPGVESCEEGERKKKEREKENEEHKRERRRRAQEKKAKKKKKKHPRILCTPVEPPD